jgi:hypothetical protein
MTPRLDGKSNEDEMNMGRRSKSSKGVNGAKSQWNELK